jgi:hypothetical protein
MNHLEEEQLLAEYYGELDEKRRGHLAECEECRAEFHRLAGLLNSTRDYPAPERAESYGRDVWARLEPKLARDPRRRWMRWWAISPALAAVIMIAFVAGALTEKRRQQNFSEKTRERVLLAALSNHLDRSQILLTELANEGPSTADLNDERARARDLVYENRLLRQTARRLGDGVYAGLLDDLERVLLDVANSPANLRPNEWAGLQQRIEDEGLLFKVRVTSIDARRKEQTL